MGLLRLVDPLDPESPVGAGDGAQPAARGSAARPDPAGRVRPAEADYEDDPRYVRARLVLALTGRCSCDDCCTAHLAGDPRAGLVGVGRRRAGPRAV